MFKRETYFIQRFDGTEDRTDSRGKLLVLNLMSLDLNERVQQHERTIQGLKVLLKEALKSNKNLNERLHTVELALAEVRQLLDDNAMRG